MDAVGIDGGIPESGLETAHVDQRNDIDSVGAVHKFADSWVGRGVTFEVGKY